MIIFLFTGWFIFAAIKASKMGPLTKEEEFLPSSHPILKVAQIINNKFAEGGSTALNMVVHFGVKDIDQEETSRWKAADIGKAVFDPEFTLSPQVNQ